LRFDKMVLSIHSFSTGIIHRTYARCQPSVRSQIGDVCRGARVSRPRRRYEAGFLASPGVPSPVSGSRRPRLPLLPLWEKGVGGMRGKRARERRREKGRQDSSREHAARAPMMGHKVERGRDALAGVMRQVFWQALACHLPFQAAGDPDSPFSPCGRRGLGG
jgi:hypothetical protein